MHKLYVRAYENIINADTRGHTRTAQGWLKKELPPAQANSPTWQSTKGPRLATLAANSSQNQLGL